MNISDVSEHWRKPLYVILSLEVKKKLPVDVQTSEYSMKFENIISKPLNNYNNPIML